MCFNVMAGTEYWACVGFTCATVVSLEISFTSPSTLPFCGDVVCAKIEENSWFCPSIEIVPLPPGVGLHSEAKTFIVEKLFFFLSMLVFVLTKILLLLFFFWLACYFSANTK